MQIRYNVNKYKYQKRRFSVMYISEIRTKAPADERMPLERKFYDTLEKLKIPYEQVDNDPASSMEECAEVDKAIGTEIRKNVFLCNQKKTTFFLLVMSMTSESLTCMIESAFIPIRRLRAFWA